MIQKQTHAARHAKLPPVAPEKSHQPVKPDIMARLKKTWGNRFFSAREVAAMRAAELEGGKS
jgi:hypothetical protein